MERILKAWAEGDFLYIATDRGREYRCPLAAFPILNAAIKEQREKYEINKYGDSIRWPEVDEDIHLSSFTGAAKEPETFAAPHPGCLLKKELQKRGISQKQFADLIGMQRTALNEIANGKRPITAETALKIEAATGLNAKMWIGMQNTYNWQRAKQNSRLAATLKGIRNAAAML